MAQKRGKQEFSSSVLPSHRLETDGDGPPGYVNADKFGWWDESKLGIFFSWGLYSVLERGEWVMLRGLSLTSRN